MRSSAPSGDAQSGSRVVAFLAHAITVVLPVTFGVLIAVLVASGLGLVLYINHLAMLTLGVCWFATVAHQGGSALCERCIESVPADAPLQAKRSWLSMKFAHFLGTKAGTVATIAVCLAPMIAIAMLPAVTVGQLFVAAHLWMLVLIYVDVHHVRLRPWCPFCQRWDDGGDYEPAPGPASQTATT